MSEQGNTPTNAPAAAPRAAATAESEPTAESGVGGSVVAAGDSTPGAAVPAPAPAPAVVPLAVPAGQATAASAASEPPAEAVGGAEAGPAQTQAHNNSNAPQRQEALRRLRQRQRMRNAARSYTHAGDFVYVLELQGGMYYVGRSAQPFSRISQHHRGAGAEWTRMYRPQRVIETTPSYSPMDEDVAVRRYMLQYGIDRVRGGSYSQVQLTDAQRQFLTTELCTATNACFRCHRRGHFANRCTETTRADGTAILPNASSSPVSSSFSSSSSSPSSVSEAQGIAMAQPQAASPTRQQAAVQPALSPAPEQTATPSDFPVYLTARIVDVVTTSSREVYEPRRVRRIISGSESLQAAARTTSSSEVYERRVVRRIITSTDSLQPDLAAPRGTSVLVRTPSTEGSPAPATPPHRDDAADGAMPSLALIMDEELQPVPAALTVPLPDVPVPAPAQPAPTISIRLNLPQLAQSVDANVSIGVPSAPYGAPMTTNVSINIGALGPSSAAGLRNGSEIVTDGPVRRGGSGGQSSSIDISVTIGDGGLVGRDLVQSMGVLQIQTPPVSPTTTTSTISTTSRAAGPVVGSTSVDADYVTVTEAATATVALSNVPSSPTTTSATSATAAAATASPGSTATPSRAARPVGVVTYSSYEVYSASALK